MVRVMWDKTIHVVDVENRFRHPYLAGPARRADVTSSDLTDA
jgi:hypothetical protein